MLSRRLVKKGHEVAIAVDGQQGVDIAASQKPEIILLDMSLPVMDGWEAAKRLKADAGTSDIPIIALTAHAMAGGELELPAGDVVRDVICTTDGATKGALLPFAQLVDRYRVDADELTFGVVKAEIEAGDRK